MILWKKKSGYISRHWCEIYTTIYTRRTAGWEAGASYHNEGPIQEAQKPLNIEVCSNDFKGTPSMSRGIISIFLLGMAWEIINEIKTLPSIILVSVLEWLQELNNKNPY